MMEYERTAQYLEAEKARQHLEALKKRSVRMDAGWMRCAVRVAVPGEVEGADSV